MATEDDADTGSSASEIISVYPLELRMNRTKARLRIKVSLTKCLAPLDNSVINFDWNHVVKLYQFQYVLYSQLDSSMKLQAYKFQYTADTADTTFVAMVTDQGTYASLPSSRVMSMDGGNANFQISGGGKYQVRREGLGS